MKKTILLMLALALLCTVLCACSEGGNVNDNEGGFVTDRGNDSNIGDDIKDGAEDVGEGVKDGAEDIGEGVKDGAEDIGEGVKDGAEDIGEGIKDGAEDITNPDASPAQPQATAIPGTQVITP